MPVRLTRRELLSALEGLVKLDGQLLFLDKRRKQDVWNVLADAFSQDPLMQWLAGLRGRKDEEKRLLLEFNRSICGVINWPILARKKGVMLGVQGADGSLQAAMSVVPSGCNHETVLDTLSSLIHVGMPPIYKRAKKYYGPLAQERVEELEKLSKKRKNIMKSVGSQYLYIQQVGVLSSYQGKGLGGKLLRAVLSAADNLGAHVYLETESAENESLYKRFQFQTVEVIELRVKGDTSGDAAQPMYLMVRHPN